MYGVVQQVEGSVPITTVRLWQGPNMVVGGSIWLAGGFGPSQGDRRPSRRDLRAIGQRCCCLPRLHVSRLLGGLLVTVCVAMTPAVCVVVSSGVGANVRVSSLALFFGIGIPYAHVRRRALVGNEGWVA